jgi:hypothetical protein
MRTPLLLASSLLLLGCTERPAAPATIITSAQPPGPRSISVTGTAEIKTAPDEFVISVGVDSFAADPVAAKEANDHIMSALLSVTRGAAVDAKDVRTESFSLGPRFEGPYDSRRLTGYDAKKTLVVTMHDAEKVETVLAALFKSGANRLDGITYGSSKIIERRKEARNTAMAAAREKAEAMAAAVGQKVGRPLKIDEDHDAGGGWGRASLLNNFSNDNKSQAVVAETMATGKIRVQASVAVTFELME